MKWSLEESGQLRFYEFIKKFTIAFPEIRSIIVKRLSFTHEQVEEVLSPLVGAITDPTYKLTQKRLDVVLKMILDVKNFWKRF